MPWADRKDNYRKNPERWKGYAKKALAHRRIVRADWKRKLVDLKGGKCVDCGYCAHLAALEFDHIHGVKHAPISRMVFAGTRWSKILDELAKCELVCSNCHQIRTYERIQQKKEKAA